MDTVTGVIEVEHNEYESNDADTVASENVVAFVELLGKYFKQYHAKNISLKLSQNSNVCLTFVEN